MTKTRRNIGLLAAVTVLLGLALGITLARPTGSRTAAEAMPAVPEASLGLNVTQLMQSNSIASNTPFTEIGYSSPAKLYYVNTADGTVFYFKKTEISFPLTVGDALVEPVAVTESGQSSGGMPFMEGTYTYFCKEGFQHVWGAQVTVHWDTVSAALPEDPVKEGYTFVGWYLDEELTQPYDGRPITEDTTLYAKFEINTYTVTLNTMDGDPLDPVSAEYNTTPVIPSPTRAGYDFAGWYTDEMLETPYTAGPIKGSFTLYAKWTRSTVTVTFSTQHGSAEPQTIAYGGTVTLPELTEEGYEFLGWYTPAGTIVTAETTFTENVTLYGLWQGATVTVVFMVDGEIYDTLEVPYGAVLADVEAESNVTVQSVSMADGSLPGTDETGALLLTGAALLEVKLPEAVSPAPDADAGSAFTDYLPYIAIGIAVLCVIGAVAVSRRRA